jgi:hypothetical protein
MHLRDQIVLHEKDVPLVIGGAKMKGDLKMVDLMMAWMMMVGQKLMMGAKKDDR